MQRFLLGTFLLLLLCQLPELNAQSCAVVTSALCEPMVPLGSMVYVPPGLTFDFIQLAAIRTVTLINLGGHVAEPCKTYGIQMTCATFLRPCFVTPDNVTLPIPRELCTQVCNATYAGCSIPGVLSSYVPIGEGTYLPPGYEPPIDCINPPIDNQAYNMSFYQTGSIIFDYQGTNYSIPCSQPELVPVPLAQNCESPQVTNDIGGCSFACPLPSLSDSQYDNVKIMQGILGWFSWVSTALLVVFLSLCPRARQFPRNLIIMTACAANIAAGAIILPTMVGYENIWCGGGATLRAPETGLGVDSLGLPIVSFTVSESTLDFSSGPCTFQGAMLQFGFLAAVFWWVLIALNMCLELYFGELLSLEKAKWKWLRFGIYNVIAWGLAFVLMVIPASAGEIKFASAATYCFVSIGDDNNAWSLIFWFIPVGVSLLLGVSLFILALVRITILLVTIRKVKKLVLLYFRLFVFILVYLILIVFITAYYIQYARDEGSINDGYAQYYQCLSYGEPNCSLDDSVTNYNLVMLKSFAISSLGILLFFVFISWDVLQFWWDIMRSLYFMIKTRKMSYATVLFYKLAYSSTTRSLSGKLSGSSEMTVTNTAEGLDEEEMEEHHSSDEDGGDGSTNKKPEEQNNQNTDEGQSSSSSD